MVTCYVCAFWANAQFLSERGKKGSSFKDKGFVVGNYKVLIFFLTLALGHSR